MDQEHIKRLMPFIFVLMMSLIWFGSSQAQTSVKARSEPDQIDQLFKKARDAFLKNDITHSASYIFQAKELVKQEADRSADEAKQELDASAQNLNQLAESVRKKKIGSVTELDAAFAQTHHVLAKYYQEKASESWTQRAIAETGYYLRLAALYLEYALT